MIPISYNVRNLVVRRTTTIAAAGGIALVVFVLASALMLAEGVRRTMVGTGDPHNVLVIWKGNNAEAASRIEEANLAIIRAAPGVAQAQGKPMVLGEVVVPVFTAVKGGKGKSNLMIRGVPDGVLEFRKEVTVIEGRPPKPGSSEAMVGRGARDRFEGVGLGQSYELRKGHVVTVVGVFSAGGTAFESEVWADVDVVQEAFGRQGTVSSVRVRLDSPARYDAFEAAIERDKRLRLDAHGELEYYESHSEGTSTFVTVLGVVVAVFFSIGAMIGAVITMDATVSQRQREIGVLRAIGFTRGGIMLSFLLESLALAMIGATVGTLAALGMGFVKFSLLNLVSWTEIVFQFTPTPKILAIAFACGALMGLVGGFLPARRAARVAPIDAMRE